MSGYSTSAAQTRLLGWPEIEPSRRFILIITIFVFLCIFACMQSVFFERGSFIYGWIELRHNYMHFWLFVLKLELNTYRKDPRNICISNYSYLLWNRWRYFMMHYLCHLLFRWLRVFTRGTWSYSSGKSSPHFDVIWILVLTLLIYIR